LSFNEVEITLLVVPRFVKFKASALLLAYKSFVSLKVRIAKWLEDRSERGVPVGSLA
jgi:hypothetical protein